MSQSVNQLESMSDSIVSVKLNGIDFKIGKFLIGDQCDAMAYMRNRALNAIMQMPQLQKASIELFAEISAKTAATILIMWDIFRDDDAAAYAIWLALKRGGHAQPFEWVRGLDFPTFSKLKTITMQQAGMMEKDGEQTPPLDSSTNV